MSVFCEPRSTAGGRACWPVRVAAPEACVTVMVWAPADSVAPGVTDERPMAAAPLVICERAGATGW